MYSVRTAAAGERLISAGQRLPKAHVTRHARGIKTVRKGGAFLYQASMPRLPLPALADSLERYVYSVSPLLDGDQLRATKAAVDDFAKGAGPALHAELEARDKAAPETSFISPFWDKMYYEARSPLLLNFNPFLQFKDDDRPGMNKQTTRAAALIKSSLRFYEALQDQSLEPDVFHTEQMRTDKPWFKSLINFVPQKLAYPCAYLLKGYPLDMGQYPRLFSTTRIPKSGKDEIKYGGKPRHVAVFCRNHVYKLNVFTENGVALSDKDIQERLNFIVSDAGQGAAGAPVGCMTSENRDTWADVRSHMEKDPTNAATLNTIDTALFAVCLDDTAPESMGDASKLFLHGDARNRWFDKSFSLLVSGNGRAAVNFEHAWGDGVCVLRYANEVFDDSHEHPPPSSDRGIDSSGVEKLGWNLDNQVHAGIAAAETKADASIASLDVEIVDYFGFGKNYLKQKKLSPDGTVQMAIQLCHRRHRGLTSATYESASTAGFKGGRTETIRSVTPDSVAFVDTFLDSSASVEAKGAALRKAVETHKKVSLNAAIGKGVDRHMFALMNIAKENGDMPAVYTDPAWAKINHNILSTSTLASPALEGGGFGPVVADGYAVGYGVVDDGMRFCLGSYGMGTSDMMRNMEETLGDMKKVLEEAPVPSGAKG